MPLVDSKIPGCALFSFGTGNFPILAGFFYFSRIKLGCPPFVKSWAVMGLEGQDLIESVDSFVVFLGSQIDGSLVEKNFNFQVLLKCRI